MNNSLPNSSASLSSAQQSESVFKFAVGGDVQASDGTYLFRSVDTQLLQSCLHGQFSYVLACRQIGKSSLKNAVAEELITRGWRVVRLDLNRIGQDVPKAEDWYFSLLDEMARRLGLPLDVERWWEQFPHFTWAQRFLHFFDAVVLPNVTEPIVIFIDEIDMTLGLPYTDDLFAAIRSIHNDRSQTPAYRRLTFILLGVATPDELVDAPKRTPFNIGYPIAMRDFRNEECAPIRDLLVEYDPKRGKSYFEQIFYWANGHPYLTQKLCQAVVSRPKGEAVSVDQLVNELFFSEEELREVNLAFVHDRVLSDRHRARMLQIYRRLLRAKALSDDRNSPAINRLKLYGLVVSDGGILRVRNRIYEEVFNEQWCRDNYPRNWRRFVTYMLIAILTTILIAAIATFWNDTRTVPDRAEKAELSCYRADTSAAWMTCLTDLFTISDQYWLFSTTAHTEQALTFFFEMSAEEQLQLFEPQAMVPYTTANRVHQVYTVVENVVPNLADTRLLETENVNRTDELLQQMAATLVELKNGVSFTATIAADIDKLHRELDRWSDARLAVRRGDWSSAQQGYNQAIELNPDNRATLFERAMLMAATEQYEPALRDLERVVGLIGQLPDIPTEPTPTPTNTSTGTATFTPIPSPQTVRLTRTPGESAIFLPTPVPTIAPTETPIPIVIERITQRKLRNAVDVLFEQYPELRRQSSFTAANFPNLDDFGFIMTPTEIAAAFTPTSTDTATAVDTVTATATATPPPTIVSTSTMMPTSTPAEPTVTSPRPTATASGTEIPTATRVVPTATSTVMPAPVATATQPLPTATQPLPTTAATSTSIPTDTLTSTPPPTPNLGATQTVFTDNVATSIVATLTALVTIPPTATATPLLIATSTPEVPPTSTLAPPHIYASTANGHGNSCPSTHRNSRSHFADNTALLDSSAKRHIDQHARWFCAPTTLGTDRIFAPKQQWPND